MEERAGERRLLFLARFMVRNEERKIMKLISLCPCLDESAPARIRLCVAI
jgi:hypothetical protein